MTQRPHDLGYITGAVASAAALLVTYLVVLASSCLALRSAGGLELPEQFDTLPGRTARAMKVAFHVQSFMLVGVVLLSLLSWSRVAPSGGAFGLGLLFDAAACGAIATSVWGLLRLRVWALMSSVALASGMTGAMLHIDAFEQWFMATPALVWLALHGGLLKQVYDALASEAPRPLDAAAEGGSGVVLDLGEAGDSRPVAEVVHVESMLSTRASTAPAST